MYRRHRILLVLLGFVVLVLLRPIGEALLYDPLEIYFQNDYLTKSFPDMNLPLLWLSVSVKYVLNSLVSIGIIHVSFQNKSYTLFAFRIYFAVYVFLILMFFGILYFGQENAIRLLFYIRRFLMHPVLILVLLPAFYYQELKMKKAE